MAHKSWCKIQFLPTPLILHMFLHRPCSPWLQSYSKQERLFLTGGPFQYCSLLGLFSLACPPCLPSVMAPPSQETLSDPSIKTLFLFFPITVIYSFFLQSIFQNLYIACFLSPLPVCRSHEGRILLSYPLSGKALGLQQVMFHKYLQDL